jgi:thiosulfate dehydrogenase [quinone] large subunit
MTFNQSLGLHAHVEDPPFARLLFASTKMAWFWLVVRLYVGYAWVDAGLHKVQDPKWAFGDGSAILGFWQRAAAVPAAPAKPLVVYDWYRGVLQAMIDARSHTWFGGLVAWGELLIGAGLILGAFVGVAALFGALLNINFMLAGTAATNPVLLVLAIGLILAWKVAGYYGADRVLLPVLGTPWRGVSIEIADDPPTAPARAGLPG